MRSSHACEKNAGFQPRMISTRSGWSVTSVPPRVGRFSHFVQNTSPVVKGRGLLDETLVVWGSEFGRTPLGENRRGREANTGRDHHPYSFTLFMAGRNKRDSPA